MIKNIETTRLILVPVTEEHINDIFTHFNDEIITFMSHGVAKDISETTEVVRNFIKQRNEKTDYVFAINKKTTNEFIGLVGLHKLKNEVPELGIWTKKESHGNHYGREAIAGVIDFSKFLELKKLTYPVDRRNIASKKIPLFFQGKLITEYFKVLASDGRILEEEIYEINLGNL